MSKAFSFIGRNAWIITVLIFGIVQLGQFLYSSGVQATEIKNMKEQAVTKEDLARIEESLSSLQHSLERIENRIDIIYARRREN